MSVETAQAELMALQARNLQHTQELLKNMKPGQDVSREKENRGVLTDIKASDLPAEDANSFSNAPLEFEETTCTLWEDTQKAYHHACTANRFSDDYLQLSAVLEKNIRALGSLCLTKAALEQKGKSFPKLDEISIRDLVGMVSFHFRKTHAAFEGIYRDNNFLGITYLNWEFRWSSLNDRLRATEAKIQKIKEGKLDVDAILEENETFRDESGNKNKPAADKPRSLRANPSALPIKGSMARQMIAAEKVREKQEEQIRRERVRKQRQADRLERELLGTAGIFTPPAIFRPTKEDMAVAKLESLRRLRQELEADQTPEEEPKEQKSSEPEPTPPEEGIPESEARRILLEEAVQRNDREAIMAIPREDTEALHARWMRHLAEQERAYIESLCCGPSANTRKALREKRKKKKR